MEKVYKIVPAGTKDIYAVGYDGNRFSTETEAHEAVSHLKELGEEWDISYDVIEIEE